MTIYILRHGQAEPSIANDAARQLTDRGRRDTARVVQAHIADMGSLVQIWASPLVRAQQTACIAAEYFPGLSIQTTELLVPEADARTLLSWLDEMSKQSHQSVLLVSHQPLVGTFVNMLCGKPHDYYPMGTSSLVAIRADVVAAGMGDLLWLDHA